MSGVSGRKHGGQMHPVLIMLAVLLAAAAMTHIVPAGKFRHHDRHVVPGSYRVVPKINGLPALLSPSAPADADSPARAAGVVALFMAIPAGMTEKAGLIFMIMFVGGLFGVMRATGAVDAGVDRLVQQTSGNAYLLTTVLMFLLACGSTFLGFISEYLAIMPLVLVLGQRLGLPNLFAPAVVWIASIVGYAASASNPIVLAVAQPLAGVPIFSGIAPRLAVFFVLFGVGLAYVLLYLRRFPRVDHIPAPAALSARQVLVLLSLVPGAAALVAGTAFWSWGNVELAAAFLAFSLVLALVGGLSAVDATDAFLEGMRGMLVVCVMIGLGGSMEIILQSSQVLDSVVQGFSTLIHGHSRYAVAEYLLGAEMTFGVLIHSMSALAALSIPILAPIAHLSGVSGQVTVMALLLGSALTNLISPTSGLLLAFLAGSKVGYVEWVRFILPLFALFCALGLLAMYLMTAAGV